MIDRFSAPCLSFVRGLALVTVVDGLEGEDGVEKCMWWIR